MIASLNDRKGACMSEGQGGNEGSEFEFWFKKKKNLYISFYHDLAFSIQ